MTERLRISRSALILAALAGYFSLALIVHWWPAVGQSFISILYLFSLLLIVGCLLLVAIAAAVLRLRSDDRYRPLFVCSVGGLLLFGLVLLLSNLLSRGLPTGSYLRRFDSAIWRMEASSSYVEGDITSRQKMLGDVVDHVLPGQTRQEIERRLGPSLETPYFSESGRDLIYITGPERDTPFAIDSEWLLIWLDEHGRFERCEVVND